VGNVLTRAADSLAAERSGLFANQAFLHADQAFK
jgi:hypothetical protein